MKKAKTHVYDESKILSLSALEHIRKRTGMYIGRIGDGDQPDDGIYILLKEVLDNAVDEHIMGHGDRVTVAIEDNRVTIRDFGRGIPLGKVVECVSRINTGAKYNDDVFRFSVGLNGVGAKAVNALSVRFEVSSFRQGRTANARFERGEMKDKGAGPAPDEPDGTLIRFEPDPEIFGNARFRTDIVSERLQRYAYLNAGLRFEFDGRSFFSRDGLLDLVRDETTDEALYTPLHFRTECLELAFTHTARFDETFFSFVNGQFTSDGGAHLSAFREGLIKGFNEFSHRKFEGDEAREGMVAAVAVRLRDPIFESQTKNKLGNTEIRAGLVSDVREAVADILHRNPAAAERALARIAESVRMRRELQAVKKLARERARATSIRVPQLKDCKRHYDRRADTGRDTTLFVTEGQSAAGSIVSCRDVTTQAVFTLRGKPLNVCDLNRAIMYKNEELYNLMRSLDIEESLERLRYGRVVLATDADVDGLHIRNLLLTFFLRFFEPVVHDGHVFILETPLFRVRNRRQTLYCYSEAERDQAARQIGRSAEITRFKGLGEISPGEFKQFIGPDMRLTPVRVGHRHSVPAILNFYMARNTPERRDYIMTHLVAEDPT